MGFEGGDLSGTTEAVKVGFDGSIGLEAEGSLKDSCSTEAYKLEWTLSRTFSRNSQPEITPI